MGRELEKRAFLMRQVGSTGSTSLGWTTPSASARPRWRRENHRERRAAEQYAHRARDDVERAERLAGEGAKRRAEQAETRAQEAIDRADRAEEQSRAQRAELERELDAYTTPRKPVFGAAVFAHDAAVRAA